MTSSTDRIERKIVLRAPRTRVWRAITDSGEFGEWFGVKLEGPFERGAHVRGKMANAKYAHLPFELWIDTVDPESRFSYRWHPFAIEVGVDYSKEPTTLVEFTLADAAGGTLLTLVESGFDAVPPARRAKAFEMNSHGWEMQAQQIEKYLAHAS